MDTARRTQTKSKTAKKEKIPSIALVMLRRDLDCVFFERVTVYVRVLVSPKMGRYGL